MALGGHNGVQLMVPRVELFTPKEDLDVKPESWPIFRNGDKGVFSNLETRGEGFAVAPA